MPFSKGRWLKKAIVHWRNLKIFFSRITETILTKHGAKHPWVKWIQVRSNEGPRPFQRGHNNEIAKIRNHWTNFNQTWHKASLGERDSNLFKWKIPRGDNYEKAKIHWRNFKIFSRTTGPISTKLWKEHPWVKWIYVRSNERPRPFPRGHNNEIGKKHWRNLKTFSRITGTVSTKLGTKHRWVKGIQVCSNKELFNS